MPVVDGGPTTIVSKTKSKDVSPAFSVAQHDKEIKPQKNMKPKKPKKGCRPESSCLGGMMKDLLR